MPKDPYDLEVLFESKDWLLLKTRDGSPSLSFKSPESDWGESMHSHDGAFSETLYIYLPVLELQPPKSYTQSNTQFLSVGLGLAYNEIMTAAWSFKNGIENFQLASYESESFLSQAFESFARGEDQCPNLDTKIYNELTKTYAQITELFAKHFQIDNQGLRAHLHHLVQSGAFSFHSALTEKTQHSNQYNGIFFDAFSSNTNPDLWSETFLLDLFGNHTDRQCVVSTYAATGALKRTLKSSGFEVNLRKGYSHKRQSTLGSKGI